MKAPQEAGTFFLPSSSRFSEENYTFIVLFLSRSNILRHSFQSHFFFAKFPVLLFVSYPFFVLHFYGPFRKSFQVFYGFLICPCSFLEFLFERIMYCSKFFVCLLCSFCLAFIPCSFCFMDTF